MLNFSFFYLECEIISATFCRPVCHRSVAASLEKLIFKNRPNLRDWQLFIYFSFVNLSRFGLRSHPFAKDHPFWKWLLLLMIQLHPVLCKGLFTPSVRVNAATTLPWRYRYCFHWKQWICSRMGLQPIFEWLHSFQWEQYH